MNNLPRISNLSELTHLACYWYKAWDYRTTDGWRVIQINKEMGVYWQMGTEKTPMLDWLNFDYDEVYGPITVPS